MKDNKKVMLPVILSDVLIIISYFIYVFLPQSAFANSVEHSAMTAVYVLLSAPILCFVALGLLLISLKKCKAFFDSRFKSWVGLVAIGVTALIYMICFGFEIAFVISQFELGFAAPVDGTVYETFATFIIISSTVHLIAWAFTYLKLKAVQKNN